MVELPRMRAPALVALVRAMLAAATDDKTKERIALPAETNGLLDDLDADRVALQAALGPSATSTDTPATRAADRAEDNAVMALRELLEAWARLDGSKAADAQALLDRLFGEDERPITKLPFDEEWTAVEAKLQLLATDAKNAKGEHLRERLVALGGADFLAHLEKVHGEYGRALGITEHAAAETPAVKEKKAALETTLREYIHHLSGWNTRRTSAEKKALAARLLAPYVEAESRSSRTAKAGDGSKEPQGSKQP